MFFGWFLIASVTLLAVPFAHAGDHGLGVHRGNDTGGIISWSCEAEAAARLIAADHCARYGKFARITSVHRRYGDFIGFNCLWRPNIARFQIPAVGTRSTCRVLRARTVVRARY
jgi:hypothetical protein